MVRYYFSLALILLFISGCCSRDSGFILTDIIPEFIIPKQLESIRIGMPQEEVTKLLGLPERMYPFPNEVFNSHMILKDDRAVLVYYPENLPETLPNGSQMWFYPFPDNIEIVDAEGYCLYIDPDKKLAGWACEKHILSDDWKKIIKKQEERRNKSTAFF